MPLHARVMPMSCLSRIMSRSPRRNKARQRNERDEQHERTASGCRDSARRHYPPTRAVGSEGLSHGHGGEGRAPTNLRGGAAAADPARVDKANEFRWLLYVRGKFFA